MYLQFFGFSSAPFSDTPDVRQFWEAHSSQDIFKSVLQGLTDGFPLQTITGEPGLGKSMLCRRLLNSLRSHKSRYDVTFMPFPNLKLGHVLEANSGNSGAAQHSVLLIDEAQSMSSRSFLELASVLNRQPLALQAVLFAQPELDLRLAEADMMPLRELVTARYELRPLDIQQTAGYIEQRLNMAGGSTRFLMDSSLIPFIYTATGGIPRLINILMRKALLHACEDNCLRVDERHLQMAATTTAALAAPTKH